MKIHINIYNLIKPAENREFEIIHIHFNNDDNDITLFRLLLSTSILKILKL